jgi:hypothetical protein
MSWFMVGLLFVVFAIIIRMALDGDTGDFAISTWIISLYV